VRQFAGIAPPRVCVLVGGRVHVRECVLGGLGCIKSQDGQARIAVILADAGELGRHLGPLNAEETALQKSINAISGD
jgi:hypothetical protein